MKQTLAMMVVVLLAALMVAGCGKTADQLKLETDLSKEITGLHDGLMAKMPQVKELLAKIPELTAQGEELMKKYPKQAAALKLNDLKGASEQLVKAQSSMEAWMKTSKPYDKEMKHDEVMTALTKQKDDLTKMKTELNAALNNATATVDGQQKLVADMTAKLPGKKK